MVQLVLALVLTLAAIAAAVATYCLFSYAVLFVVGKIFPLVGKQRRR